MPVKPPTAMFVLEILEDHLHVLVIVVMLSKLSENSVTTDTCLAVLTASLNLAIHAISTLLEHLSAQLSPDATME